MKNRKTLSPSEINIKIPAVILWTVVSIILATPVFASEPGVSLIGFFACLALAPLLQVILYLILIFAEAAKPWSIILIGALSLAWSAYVSFLLVGMIASINFLFTISIFLIAYFIKISRIKAKKLPPGK